MMLHHRNFFGRRNSLHDCINTWRLNVRYYKVGLKLYLKALGAARARVSANLTLAKFRKGGQNSLLPHIQPHDCKYHDLYSLEEQRR